MECEQGIKNKDDLLALTVTSNNIIEEIYLSGP